MLKTEGTCVSDITGCQASAMAEGEAMLQATGA